MSTDELLFFDRLPLCICHDFYAVLEEVGPAEGVSDDLLRAACQSRIAPNRATAEAYPDRWIHHVILERAEDLDGELLGWPDKAYWFWMIK